MNDDFNANWSWRKGNSKGAPPARSEGYSEGCDPADRIGRKDFCQDCPSSLLCLTMPLARDVRNNYLHGKRPSGHLHFCPKCKKNYFELYTNTATEEESDVHPMCPALLDTEDKEWSASQCWSCRHGVTVTQDSY